MRKRSVGENDIRECPDIENGNKTSDAALQLDNDVSHEETVAEYLKALADFGGTEPDADGIATIEFGAVMIHLAETETRPGRIVARAEIGPVDGLASPDVFLEGLLTGAFFGRGTQLATPSVDDGVAYLTVACRTGLLATAESLETFVQRFSVLVRQWRTRLTLCAKADVDGRSVATPPETDIPDYERILV